METDRLKQFCVIVETGSLTKAADLLNMSHSGLSKSMKLLQEELKIMLLQPQGRGIAITENGREIYVKAKGLLTQIHRLLEVPLPPLQDRVRIGAMEIFLTHVISTGIHDYFKDTAFTLLESTPGKMESMILNRELDFGITHVPIPMEGIEVVEVAKFPLGCFVLEGAFKKTKLADLPFVVPAQGLSNNPLNIKETDGWNDSIHPRLRQYEVNLLSTALELTLKGLCAVYIPYFIAKKTKLVEFSLPEPLHQNRQRAFLIRRANEPEDKNFKKLAAMIRVALR